MGKIINRIREREREIAYEKLKRGILANRTVALQEGAYVQRAEYTGINQYQQSQNELANKLALNMPLSPRSPLDPA